MIEDILADLQRQIDRLQSQLDELQTQEGNLANNYGYVNGAWQKDPLTIGYSDTVLRSWSNLNLAAGANTVSDSAVPAGEIWIITNIATWYIGTITGVVLTARINSGGSQYVIFRQSPIVSDTIYDRQGYWVLKPGDNLEIRVTNATLNDDAFGTAIGFRVDIDL